MAVTGKAIDARTRVAPHGLPGKGGWGAGTSFLGRNAIKAFRAAGPGTTAYLGANYLAPEGAEPGAGAAITTLMMQAGSSAARRFLRNNGGTQRLQGNFTDAQGRLRDMIGPNDARLAGDTPDMTPDYVRGGQIDPALGTRLSDAEASLTAFQNRTPGAPGTGSEWRRHLDSNPELKTEYDTLLAQRRAQRRNVEAAQGGPRPDTRDPIYARLEPALRGTPDQRNATYGDVLRGLEPGPSGTYTFNPDRIYTAPKGRNARIDQAAMDRRNRAQAVATEFQNRGIDLADIAGRNLDFKANPSPGVDPTDQRALTRAQSALSAIETKIGTLRNQATGAYRAGEQARGDEAAAELERLTTARDAIREEASTLYRNRAESQGAEGENVDSALADMNRAERGLAADRGLDRTLAAAPWLTAAGTSLASRNETAANTLEALPGELYERNVPERAQNWINEQKAKLQAKGQEALDWRTIGKYAAGIGGVALLGLLVYKMMDDDDEDKKDEKAPAQPSRRGRPPGTGRPRGRPPKYVTA